MEQQIRQYLQKIQGEFWTGKATEHTYRPALKELLESINPNIKALNEGQRTVKVWAPDFRILKWELELWWIEVKDLHVSLDDKSNKAQLQRYLDASDNLIFTNNLEFRYFKNKQLVHSVSLGKIENGKLVIHESNLLGNNIEALGNLLQDFLGYEWQRIKSSKELAIIMAGKARMLNDIILNVLNEEEDVDESLQAQYKAFKDMLVHDLKPEQFSDMYAQTIVYGLFVARLHDSTLEDFSREEAEKLIPKSNDFLRNLFRHIAFELDERISWIVDSLVEIFNHCDIKELLEKHWKSTSRNDPVIHFYETFLTEYNPKLRKSRGVYYTPEPVVSFIVRGIDHVLKNDFGLSQWLADTSKIDIEVKQQAFDKRTKDWLKKVIKSTHRVQLLDPATGTGTFLNEVVKHVYEQFGKNNQGIWNSYVNEHLLPRVFWFELLMAPYTMAHLKLWLTLADTWYTDIQSKIGIYLTNSLEEAHNDTQSLFSTWLSAESKKASDIKNNAPIMIVTWNPPYSWISTNKGEWITKLIDEYKYINGEYFNEKKHRLNDDYVKFIRFWEHFIEKRWEWILAYITNNWYLDNPTFRWMRQHLLNTFDKIYICDLHGNWLKKEKTPEGWKDENVFDIQVGTAIILWVKTGEKKKWELGKLYHVDLYGKREEKYNKLWDNSIDTMWYKEIIPENTNYFFIQSDSKKGKVYREGLSLQKIFIKNVSWIVTARDKFILDFNKSDLENRLQIFRDVNISNQEIQQKFNLKETRWWKIAVAKEKLQKDYNKNLYNEVLYRPFDKRYIYYSSDMVDRPRKELMPNMLKNNIAIISPKQFKERPWVFLSDWLTCHKTVSAYDINYIFPIYIYQTDISWSESRIPNLNLEFINNISNNLWLQFVQDGKWDKTNTFGPEDVFDYIYAVLHSPTYREKYKEFLKIDFPRIPFTKDKVIFNQLIKYWEELRKIHLLEMGGTNENVVSYPMGGDNKVENIKYWDNKVWINDTQYFDGVHQIAWEFYIGGYQPAQKWLKDRKDRILNSDDVIHYQKMIVALIETDRVMKDIDKIKFI